MRAHLALLLFCALAAAGCDQLGIETPAITAARDQADAKAIGGACRHAGRAIEDCYTLNAKASKTAMYDGWREMNDYMRENKIEPVAPLVPRDAPVKPAPPPPKASAPDPDAEEDVADEPSAKKRGH